jgi:hypothetical protein
MAFAVIVPVICAAGIETIDPIDIVVPLYVIPFDPPNLNVPFEFQ